MNGLGAVHSSSVFSDMYMTPHHSQGGGRRSFDEIEAELLDGQKLQVRGHAKRP